MTSSTNDDGQCCRQTLSDQSCISALRRSDSDVRVHTVVWHVGGSMSANCTALVQFPVSADSGWPLNALQYAISGCLCSQLPLRMLYRAAGGNKCGR